MIKKVLSFDIFGRHTGTLIKGGGAGIAIAPTHFGRIEGAAGQRRRAALLLAPPVLGSY